MSPPPSHRFLRRLAVVPVWAVFLAVLALTIGGLLTRGALSAALLACVALLLGVLAAAQWPLLPPNQRVVRLVAIVAVAGVAAYRLVAS